jgi:hypothetical protein
MKEMKTIMTRNIKMCHQRIAHLEEQNEALSDALNKIDNEYAHALSEKDRLIMNKCKTCTRGIPR